MDMCICAAFIYIYMCVCRYVCICVNIYIYMLVGFRRAVIFSVKEYTNNELTKTKNKKKQNKTK